MNRLMLDGQPLIPRCGLDGDALSYEAQATYERQTVAVARAIAAGELDTPPTREHLRVLLDWLDGAESRQSALDEQPF